MIIRCYGDDLAGFINYDFHAPPQCNAPVNATAMVRNSSNLLPPPTFQPAKVLVAVDPMKTDGVGWPARARKPSI
ncbi:hypothetical protein ABIF65_011424 [Bradyrhizobium japonicum]